MPFAGHRPRLGSSAPGSRSLPRGKGGFWLGAVLLTIAVGLAAGAYTLKLGGRSTTGL
jgi:hypothetical protein